jgi:hypothetical protein
MADCDFDSLEHEELHKDHKGLEPDSWDPSVDKDEGDPGAEAAASGDLVEPSAPPTPATALRSAGPPNPSGLSDAHRVEARDLAVAAGMLAYHHRDRVHYSQNAVLRWSGIHNDYKAYQGEYPKYADCSSYNTWCLWNGLDHFGVRDVVNAAFWLYGYTGTMLKHGVPGSEWVMRGDCVIYGSRWPGLHVAMCIGGGMVLSHGSERGPLLLPINYRGDVLARRRYI